MYCTFIVVDNNVSEMRFWADKESAIDAYKLQCKLTEKHFGYTKEVDIPIDFESGQIKKTIYKHKENNTECIVYLYADLFEVDLTNEDFS